MEYRTLGRTGVQVSRLCFGTMSFGGDADEATSAAMFRRCRDAGINFFDCANVYAGGRSEEILGRAMAGEPRRAGDHVESPLPDGPGREPARPVAAPHHAGREGSLRRLATDRIDLYFVHGFDPLTPIDETLRALDDLVQPGEGPLPRRQQLGRVADRQGAGHLSPARPGALRVHPADVQPGQAPGRGGDPAAGASPNRWGSSPTARWAAAC